MLAAIDKHGHFYQVATEDKIYLLMCTKVKTIQLFGMPECKLGDKPIANGDAIHFRVDGDWAYMAPVSEGVEEKLRVLTTELKVIPPLPDADPSASAVNGTSATANQKGAKSTAEAGVVIGMGMQVKGQHGSSWSTTPGPVSSPVTTASASTPVTPTGPVVATPVTGGAPVVMVPTAPAAGGVITGVPVTGGAPITAVPVAPVAGVPAAGTRPGGGQVTMGGGGAPQWVHILRIKTRDKTYQLECSGKPCKIADKEIALGDAITLRADKKHAYLSFGGQTAGEQNAGQNSGEAQEYKILSVTENGTTSQSKSE